MGQAELVDMATIEQMKGMIGDAFDNIVQQFFLSTPTLIAELLQAHSDSNSDKMIEVAHKIKSGSGSIGFVAIKDEARTIEESLRQDPGADVSSSIVALEDYYQRTKDQLNG